MTTGIFAEPAPRFSVDGLRSVLREHWSLTAAELAPLDSERDLNVLVDGRFVLKISNPAESVEVVDMETQALQHIRAADPGLPVPEIVGVPVAVVRDSSDRECLTRLITLLPGSPVEGGPLDPSLAVQIGAIAGRVSVALQGFFHSAAGRSLMWDIRRMPSVVAAAGIGMGSVVDRAVPALKATASLPSGVQHGDVTLTNVLADNGTVTGVIDFGDMHHTAAVADLAVTLTSVLRRSSSDLLWPLTEAVLRGYHGHRALSPAEVAVLGELVIARLLTTLAVSASRRGAHADNHRYITQYDNSSSRALDLLSGFSPDDLADRLSRLAGTRDLAGAVTSADLPAKRAETMGGKLSPLFYDRPLEIARGSGPWLFAKDGARYLDAYNNVAVIGHAHPAVTRAVGLQMASLNTHSRYLHGGIVDLATRILATMPAPLDTILFTTSGTEANELAWRLATEYTGGDTAIIAEHAYHGSSKWMADLSSNEWPPGHRPPHVATFEAPRGPELSETVGAARISLAAEGLRPALVLVDSQFTSEGILDAPGTFFAGLVSGAHAAGALYLADEVQSGYGRSGPQLWRFLLSGITPDIVTLGKPMGAGYPIGAVVTRRAIADALAARYEYFSTFAATPAAAAAGHAVLDILDLTSLPAQAASLGSLLRSRLRDLDSPLLGEVRGTGLLAGIDVLPAGSLTSRQVTQSLLSSLVAQGVLAGSTGPRGDVLKVRPPLVWEERHVTHFVDRLQHALRATGEQGGVVTKLASG
ncbi:aminotransferase class III-fold pyridoxal phosphate-dependent enzyme [Kutzneria sp. 744]|uniref:aminotransferase class III-fold pyridoxal phosphate-dependent enzyme n=1 Tax=Kutzneria sp. (strain 744) TaxID=345341 RepID=UPI0003EEA924|nr:aminotransferase class III-fold pyridoxal phosphate-dependent enzyme [Kutzneria sp. 744]EWM09939.1 aminotransferase, class III [Kutzneria sp. 744]